MENKQGGTAGENSRPCGGVFVLYIIQRIRSIPKKDASFCSKETRQKYSWERKKTK